MLAATRKIALCISCTYWEPAYTALLEDESLNIQIFLPGSMDEQAEEVADKKFGKESMNQLYLRDFSSMPVHSAKEKEEPKDDPNQLSLF